MTEAKNNKQNPEVPSNRTVTLEALLDETFFPGSSLRDEAHLVERSSFGSREDIGVILVNTPGGEIFLKASRDVWSAGREEELGENAIILAWALGKNQIFASSLAHQEGDRIKITNAQLNGLAQTGTDLQSDVVLLFPWHNHPKTKDFEYSPLSPGDVVAMCNVALSSPIIPIGTQIYDIDDVATQELQDRGILPTLDQGQEKGRPYIGVGVRNRNGAQIALRLPETPVLTIQASEDFIKRVTEESNALLVAYTQASSMHVAVRAGEERNNIMTNEVMALLPKNFTTIDSGIDNSFVRDLKELVGRISQETIRLSQVQARARIDFWPKDGSENDEALALHRQTELEIRRKEREPVMVQFVKAELQQVMLMRYARELLFHVFNLNEEGNAFVIDKRSVE